MYKKYVKKLILFFMIVLIADQATIYAGRRSRKTIFKASDERSYSVEGRKKTRKERQQKEQETLDRNISSTQQATEQAQKEKQKIKRSIVLAEQENTKAEQEIAANKVQVEELKQKIDDPANAQSKSTLSGLLDSAKQKIKNLTQVVVNNKGKIAAGVAILGAGYLYLTNRGGGDSGQIYDVDLSSVNKDEMMREIQELKDTGAYNFSTTDKTLKAKVEALDKKYGSDNVDKVLASLKKQD